MTSVYKVMKAESTCRWGGGSLFLSSCLTSMNKWEQQRLQLEMIRRGIPAHGGRPLIRRSGRQKRLHNKSPEFGTRSVLREAPQWAPNYYQVQTPPNAPEWCRHSVLAGFSPLSRWPLTLIFVKSAAGVSLRMFTCINTLLSKAIKPASLGLFLEMMSTYIMNVVMIHYWWSEVSCSHDHITTSQPKVKGNKFCTFWRGKLVKDLRWCTELTKCLMGVMS